MPFRVIHCLVCTVMVTLYSENVFFHNELTADWSVNSSISELIGQLINQSQKKCLREVLSGFVRATRVIDKDNPPYTIFSQNL